MYILVDAYLLKYLSSMIYLNMRIIVYFSPTKNLPWKPKGGGVQLLWKLIFKFQCNIFCWKWLFLHFIVLFNISVLFIFLRRWRYVNGKALFVPVHNQMQRNSEYHKIFSFSCCQGKKISRWVLFSPFYKLNEYENMTDKISHPA